MKTPLKEGEASTAITANEVGEKGLQRVRMCERREREQLPETVRAKQVHEGSVSSAARTDQQTHQNNSWKKQALLVWVGNSPELCFRLNVLVLSVLYACAMWVSDL